MEILQEIRYFFARERRVIAKAPVTFALALCILSGILGLVIRAHYMARLTWQEEQLKRQEEQLRSKDDQLKGKDEQLAGKDDQLRGKDNLITEYRERLRLLPPAESPFLRLTNAELRQKALTIVQQL